MKPHQSWDGKTIIEKWKPKSTKNKPQTKQQNTPHDYIEPPYVFKYPRPYKPGHIKGTKKEWVPCAVCKTLFIRRIDKIKQPRKTCGNNICVDVNRRNSIAAWQKSDEGMAWKKQYNATHKDEMRAYWRKADKKRANNPKRIKQKRQTSLLWYHNNKQYYKEYYQKNRLKILAKHKAQREAASK